MQSRMRVKVFQEGRPEGRNLKVQFCLPQGLASFQGSHGSAFFFLLSSESHAVNMSVSLSICCVYLALAVSFHPNRAVQ